MAFAAGASALALVLFFGWRGHREIRAWYLLYTGFVRLPDNAQGYAEYRHRHTGLVFVRLPGGRFLMGSPETEANARPEEHPQHWVSLSPFLIAKYELSQGVWQRFMNGNRSTGARGDDLPVDGISWNNCQDFCERTGLAMPTEAQWEYACRAGTTTAFSFGANVVETQVNYDSGSVVPVDSFPANGFGLHNMHGNVRELCADAFRPDFYSTREALLSDPLCATDGNPRGSEQRVNRGGACFTGRRWSRSASRYGIKCDNDMTDQYIGFRPGFNLR